MDELIRRLATHLRAASYSERTIADRVRLLDHANRCLPQGLLATADEIAEYLGSPGWSDWTRSTYWAHLFSFYQWAVDRGEITHNPMTELRRPDTGDSVPDPVTDEELHLALQRSPDLPWRTAIMLAAYAGLRCSEIARIRRQDITELDVRVRQGKGNKDRVIPTHPALWEYIRDRPRGELTRTVNGFPMTGTQLTQRQHLHWRSVDLVGLHWHRFRHWYATTLLRNGADIRVVQELLGHASIVTTQGYTKVVSEQRRFAVSTLPAPATSPLQTAA